MTALDNLKRLAEKLERFHRPRKSDWLADHTPDGIAYKVAVNPANILALIAEFEQQERKTERLESIVLRAMATFRRKDGKPVAATASTWPALADVDEAVADLQADSPPPFAREGMVTVYGDKGEYLGCMGRERWERLLSEDAPPIARDPVQDAPRSLWT